MQTSIAISAGIASNPLPDLAVRPKCVIRLDAFLGEWLSPDYFEHITPPPRSSLMLATAKAELLRREHYTDSPSIHSARKQVGSQGQLWSPKPGASSPSRAGLDDISPLKDTPPDGYQSPVPTYAVGPHDPIPRGYVAHARDACADIDYQWDSSREDTIGWGDGGVLPEEWASMHQRFRRGFRRLVDWYATTEHPSQMVTKTTRSAAYGTAVAEHAEVDEDVDEENIVILVSHGAGCNALVGAITQQPVLADVAMSSISMAKRKPLFDEPNDIFDGKPASSLEEGLSRMKITMQEVFDLKLFANTDHLQTTVSSPGISRTSSLAGHGRNNSRVKPGPALQSALREMSLGSVYGAGLVGGARSISVNAALGSMRRGSHSPALSPRPEPATRNSGAGITVGSSLSSLVGFSSSRDRSESFGLWQSKNEEAIEDDDEQPMLLNFSFEKEAKKDSSPLAASVPADAHDRVQTADESSLLKAEATDHFAEDAVVSHLWAGTGNGGLWGAPRPPGKAERIRDHTATKRRWTVNERETIV
ncbi:hypothetical protein MN608_03056 [Microdochium nivale]|nr:hypothetical protein MN608_03056 [Microdochium nivale]